MGEQKRPSSRSLPWSESEMSGQLCPVQGSEARAGTGGFFDKFMKNLLAVRDCCQGSPLKRGVRLTDGLSSAKQNEVVVVVLESSCRVVRKRSQPVLLFARAWQLGLP